MDLADEELFRQAKESGFSDRQLADFWNCEPSEVHSDPSYPQLFAWWIPAPQNLRLTLHIIIPLMV